MRKIKLLLGFAIGFILIITLCVYAQYIPTNKDTRKAPEPVEYIIQRPEDFQLLKETEHFAFYFKDERDVLAIFDKRNGYLWKTGLDVPFAQEVRNACREAPLEEKMKVCVPIEDRLSTPFTALANSLLTIEYYDTALTIKRISSASDSNVQSTLYQVIGDDSHYILDINFFSPLINIKLHIYLTDKGVSYEVRYDEITGKDRNRLAAILISPFLGASGGKQIFYNPGLLDENGEYITDEYGFPIDEGGYSGNGDYVRDENGNIVFDEFGRPIKNTEPVPKYRVPGYVLVPDGPGALIRFVDFNTELTSYTGKVYGNDNSLNMMYYSSQRGFVAYKEPVMPVFGIAHGHNQAAFVAYATKGDEHMEIIVTPDEGMRTHYTWAYPRFVYNYKYFQIYNRAGAGYEKLLDPEQMSPFDINIHYEFLANDGSEDGKPASYIGMAKAYREFLIEQGILTPMQTNAHRIPLRLDFVMSDAKRNIVGFDDVVVTTINDVEDIIHDIMDMGIRNINVGLMGFQKGGITLGRPDRIRYNREIGSKKEFIQVIERLKHDGIDVSLVQDFVTINEHRVSLLGNATRHATNWYTRTFLYDPEAPVNTVYYARAKKSKAWLNDFMKDMDDLPVSSFTIDGMQRILFTDYTGGLTTRRSIITTYQEAFEKATSKYMINAKNPNMYSWRYIDRYLEAPVFSTQYIISTDTVPFLQMVLHGTMEVYAPYSNFSFYTDQDILRMIDYNVYPSFVLTKEPAYLLMATNSSNYYSTEYTLYKNLIATIYERVDRALGQVMGSDWINRTVVENGVIVNTYSNGVEIVINYTDEPFTYKGITIGPVSYEVIR